MKKLFWLKVYSPLNNKNSNRDSFPLNYCLMSILTRYFRIPIFAPVCSVHILLLWKQQFRPIFPALTQSVLFLILLPPILMDFQLSPVPGAGAGWWPVWQQASDPGYKPPMIQGLPPHSSAPPPPHSLKPLAYTHATLKLHRGVPDPVHFCHLKMKTLISVIFARIYSLYITCIVSVQADSSVSWLDTETEDVTWPGSPDM